MPLIDMSEADARLLQDLLRSLRNTRGGGHVTAQLVPGVGLSIVGNGGGGSASAAIGRVVRMRIKQQYNNYLRCRTWDGSNEGSSDIYVAKKPTLRHSTSYYPWLSTLTTTDTETVAVTYVASGDTIAETWKTTPPWTTNTEIFAVQTKGGTGEASAPTWLELTGREWGVVE